MKGKTHYGSCRHCPFVGELRHRRLCWRCYDNPAIREMYPKLREAYHGDGDFYGGYGLAPTPMTSRPGSPQRIEELAERVRLKVALFRPDDYAGDVA